uniref:Glycerol-3-phosphate dehydrogenase [NAD(+)] n=1 Tax=Cyprinus carpio TaxID=7962 RepID=A0A8C2GWT3_CYPCA
MPGKKVCIIGSGNWGSAIAKIIGHNVKASNRFDPMVKMWVYEEMIDGRKLTEIINTEHENVKYLPGHKLPKNVVAVPDVPEATSGADLLIFVIPHQFIGKICDQMKPHVKPGATGISLIKGIDEGPDGLTLISDIIRSKLEIEVSVLMGANIATEVAEEKFCETTIGATNESNGKIFKELLQTPNFRITVVKESDTVELCGALKVLSSHNDLEVIFKTSSHLFRLLMLFLFNLLFIKYIRHDVSVFHQSIVELEAEMLNGQKLQGPQTSAEVYKILQKKSMVDKFPLFVSVYQICFEGRQVQDFISCLQNHPEHM